MGSKAGISGMTKEHRYKMVKELTLVGNIGELVLMLDESNPFFNGATANQVIRIKGFILAAFAEIGCPAGVLVYISEELENSVSPYLIGAAARALRGYSPPVAEGIPLLLHGIENLVHGDDSFSFDQITPEGTSPNDTSALLEILKTFVFYGNAAKNEWEQLSVILGQGRFYLNDQAKALIVDMEKKIVEHSVAGSCCDEDHITKSKHVPGRWFKKRYIQLDHILLEDQQNEQFSFKQFFSGSVTVLTFFYTRCDNPNKCSLTITRFAQLQRLIEEAALNDVKLAAITYDPDFDHGYRLKNYCEHRQLHFGEHTKAFSVRTGYNDLKSYLRLNVNYGGRIVNRHSIELYILNRYGKVINTYKRTQWDETKVLADIRALLSEQKTIGYRLLGIANNIVSVLYSLVIAFFPKCPLCLMAYLSAVGLTGIDVWSLGRWLMPALILFLGINLFVLYRRSRSRGVYLPLIVTSIGITLLLTNHLLLPSNLFKTGGLVLMVIGALLNSLKKTQIRNASHVLTSWLKNRSETIRVGT